MKLKDMKRFLLILVSLSIVGCAPFGGTFMYSGVGTFQDFASARFACSQAAQGTSSSGYFDSFSGSFSTTPTVNCGMMDACLASKGFVRDPNGPLDASSMKVSCSN